MQRLAFGVKKRPSEFSTPERSSKQCKALVDITPEKPDAWGTDETDAIMALFVGLETVLPLLRGRRPSFEAIKEHVERSSHKTFCQDRLATILDLAGGMLEASWVGVGSDAVLEVRQRCGDNSENRIPSPKELMERQNAFEASMRSVVQRNGQLPPSSLPPRPRKPALSPTTSESFLKQNFGSPVAYTPKKVDESPCCLSERKTSLRDRIRAREEVDRFNKDTMAALQRLVKRQDVIENAVKLIPIVQQLFARGGGRLIAQAEDREGTSGASEAEIVKAACSQSYGMQTKQCMEPQAAREAIQHLANRASGWFTMEQSQHSKNANLLLSRLPGGSSSVASAALDAEREEIQREGAQLNGAVRLSSASASSCVMSTATAEDSSSVTEPVPSLPLRLRLRGKQSGSNSA